MNGPLHLRCIQHQDLRIVLIVGIDLTNNHNLYPFPNIEHYSSIERFGYAVCIRKLCRGGLRCGVNGIRGYVVCGVTTFIE